MPESTEHGDLKHKTAPEAPEIPKDHVPQSPNKVTRILAKLSRPLVAVVVVLAVMGVGYFGYVNSSADTHAQQVFEFDRSAVNCPDKMTNAACKEKKDRKRAAALEDFKASCNVLNRDYNNNNEACRTCKPGFVENANNVCKSRDTVNCALTFREQDGPYDCSKKCINGYSVAPSGDCKREVDCSNGNRVQATKYQCGACKNGFAENGNDVCKELVNCTGQNRATINAFKCGECKGGFEENANGNCKAKQKIDCSKQFRAQKGDYDCGGCITKYSPNANGVCKKDAAGGGTTKQDDSAAIKEDCNTNKHLQYDSAKKACKATCVPGFSFNKAGKCVENDKSTGGVTGGSETNCPAGSTAARCAAQSVEPTCTAQNRKYNAKKNICTDKCISTAYYFSGSKCLPVAIPKEDPVVAAKCAAVFKVYDKKTNACVNTCVDGYYLKDKKCVKVPAKVTDCKKKNTNGSCATDEDLVKAVCKGQHLEYSDKKNACKSTCVEGYYKVAATNSCQKVGEGNPATIKAGCDALKLTYSPRANLCLPNCTEDYVMRDGACIKWEDAGMTKARCEALGREWQTTAETTLEDGTVVAATALCSTICINEDTIIANAQDVNTAYCKPKSTTAASKTDVNVVSTDITKKECTKQNRAWIEALNACAARCKSDFYVSDTKCAPKEVAVNAVTQGTGSTGNGTTDGCQSDLQGVTKLCPDQPEVTPPTSANDGKIIAHNVDITLTHEACNLLGREWVPNTKNKLKQPVYGGCSTQKCNEAKVKARGDQKTGAVYCPGYVEKISKVQCQNLHRVWTPIVSGCLMNPNQDRTKPRVDAKQCVAPNTVYVFHTVAEGSSDECVKPTTYEKAKDVLSNTTKPVAYVVTRPAMVTCLARSNMQWIDNHCVKKRVPKAPAQTAETGMGNDGTNGHAVKTSNGCPAGQRKLDGVCSSVSYGDDHRSPGSNPAKEGKTVCAGFEINGKCSKIVKVVDSSDWDAIQ